MLLFPDAFAPIRSVNGPSVNSASLKFLNRSSRSFFSTSLTPVPDHSARMAAPGHGCRRSPARLPHRFFLRCCSLLLLLAQDPTANDLNSDTCRRPHPNRLTQPAVEFCTPKSSHKEEEAEEEQEPAEQQARLAAAESQADAR